MPAMVLGGAPGEGLALACVGEGGQAWLALAAREDAGFEGATWHPVASLPQERPRVAGTARHLAISVGETATGFGVAEDGAVDDVRVAAVPAGSRPLAYDGRWLLTRAGWSGLDLLDLQEPGVRFSYESFRHVLRGVAVPGGFVAFTGGIAGERPGWIEVRLDGDGAPPAFVRRVRDLVGEVFDAHATGGKLLIGAWTGTHDQARVRVMLLALDGGGPTWPPLVTLDLPNLVRSNGPAFLAWDGEATGVVWQLAWRADRYTGCFWSMPGVACRLATGPVAHVLRVDEASLSAEPVLLPYLEYEPALHDATGRPAPVVTARAGRLLAVQGPPYVLAEYALEPR
jgi:hypothetical protein